jgi:hypothetical protein
MGDFYHDQGESILTYEREREVLMNRRSCPTSGF